MATDEVLTRISDYSEAQNGGENYVKNNSIICTHHQILLGGEGVHAVARLVEALLYKSEGHSFDYRWCH
jgi:hypothetical protein